MDDAALVGAVVGVLAVLAVGTAGTAGYLYAIDYTLKADVQDKACLGPVQPDDANVVSVRTRAFGIEHEVAGIPDQQCQFLSEGNYVEYRIRSKHTTLYEREGGRCIYDSVTGALCDVVS